MQKIVLILICVSAAIWSLNNEGTGKERHDTQITLRLAESLPKTNPVVISMRKFSDLVNRKTDGEVEVKIYSSAQLGQEPETIEQVQLGIIDFARINSVALANVSPSVGVFTLPYIFKDEAHKYRILDGAIGERIRADMEDVGLIGFDYLDAGSRSFYTRSRIIKDISDLKGMKIRVQPSLVTIRMIELLGAIPTPINFGEVYSSLSTGVVDGAENDYVSYYSSGHYEVAPFYVENNHLSAPAVLVMNLDKFNSLNISYQQAIREAAHEAAQFERKLMRESNLKAKAKLESLDVTMSAIDTSAFRTAVEPIYREYPLYRNLIHQISMID